MESTKHRARQAVFWPGINSNIVNTIVACESCQVLQPTQQQEPSMNADNLTKPFESVSADLFTVTGKAFLVKLDQLSGWPAVVPCKGDTTASDTIRIFCCYLQEVGVSLHLRTDGGQQFTSNEFLDFMERRKIQCNLGHRCDECRDWSTDQMQAYIKHRKALTSKSKARLAPGVKPKAEERYPSDLGVSFF
ncbi:uncharacterized protein LOC135204556 [Macrobrachium nipponense]|uniref:uncharacterized protein LOC135204556 n=1 Tax=Macrobrachium nipponense TaxID=159736 RepID=UPI0030C87F53